MPEFFTMLELSIHNKLDDIWVSIFGNVYDITELIRENSNEDFIRPLIAYAGKDISHWFDIETCEPNVCVDPENGQSKIYCAHGQFFKSNETFWWTLDKYFIGLLTQNSRPIRLVNMLTGDESLIEVCSEHTLGQILEKYWFYNRNIHDYLPYFNCQLLDLEKTLDENGLEDDRQWFIDHGLPDTLFIPAILLYFKEFF